MTWVSRSRCTPDVVTLEACLLGLGELPNRPMKLAFYASIAALGLTSACSSPPPSSSSCTTSAPAAGVCRGGRRHLLRSRRPRRARSRRADARREEEGRRARELAEDRAKMEADIKAESARWTPELHADAKALADKTYPTRQGRHPSGDGGQAAQARRHATRDKYRHPLETLEFFGFKPTMTVLEYGPGEGWYTELLAPALAKKGKLLATNSDPNGPADDARHVLWPALQGVPRHGARALRQGRRPIIIGRQDAEARARRHGRHGARHARAPRDGRTAASSTSGSPRSTRPSSRGGVLGIEAAPRAADAEPGRRAPRRAICRRRGSSSRSRPRASSSRASPRSTPTRRTRRTTPKACGRCRRRTA